MTNKPGRPFKRTPPIPAKGSRLTVIKYLYTVSKWDGAGGYQVWRCSCECGEIVDVHRHRIQSGGTKSCGCLRRELGKKRLPKARAVYSEQCRIKREHANAG